MSSSLKALPSISSCLLALALATAPVLPAMEAVTTVGTDPFSIATFESGWKVVSKVAVTGISSDGSRTAVAWAPLGYIVTKDGGFTWSRPVMPSSGPVGAPGSQPVQVADAAVVVGNQGGPGSVFVRTVDGAIRDAGGIPLNPQLGLGPVTAMAAGGDGTLYCETQRETVAIRNGRVAGRSPGQLVGAFRDSCATFEAGVMRRLASSTGAVTPLSMKGADANAVRAPAWASGPAFGYSCRDEAGASWRLDGGTLVHAGTPQGLSVLSLGGVAGLRVSGMVFVAVGLARDSGSETSYAIIGQDESGALRRMSTDVPADCAAVCGVDHRDGSRYRLLAATRNGVQMYRSR